MYALSTLHSCIPFSFIPVCLSGRAGKKERGKEKQHPRPTWTSHTQNEEEDVKREEVRREVQDYDQPSVFFQYWFSQYQKEMCKREEKANTRRGRRGTWKRKKRHPTEEEGNKTKGRQATDVTHIHFVPFFVSSGERTCLLFPSASSFCFLIPHMRMSSFIPCRSEIQRYKNPVSS